jgi:hypothetical protein
LRLTTFEPVASRKTEMLDKNLVTRALLEQNYFPAQRRRREELPPVFTSGSFTPTVASNLASIKLAKGIKGFDVVDYRTTKFNNVSRSLSIPHPVGYSQLALKLTSSWQEVSNLLGSPVSRIQPKNYPDGRIIVMDYDNFATRNKRSRDLAFGKRYVVHTDISNCFPSIYTHAISWAAVGLTQAKSKISGEWHHEIDKLARQITRDETQGVPVGPATSNVIAEMILGRIDNTLVDEFGDRVDPTTIPLSRFIDDYTFYCESDSEGHKFLRRLEEELAKFKLRLNPRKTSIEETRFPSSESWKTALALNAPHQGSEVSVYQATNYLELAVRLAKENPESSVLKYAANSLLRCDLSSTAQVATLDCLLMLAFHYPVLLPSLSQLIDDTWFDGASAFSARYVKILGRCAELRQSDGMAWALYYLRRNGISIPATVAKQVVKTEDCVSLLMLYLEGVHKQLVIDWVNQLPKTDSYKLDRNWLLLYQMYIEGDVKEDMCSTPEAFERLKLASVTFVDLSK